MNKWDSKKIAFISILIAMSISFVIIGTRFFALTSIPAFKLSVSGLPIKIIGFLFGPVIGFITGFVTDIISFIFIPAFYFPLYSVALGVSGSLPGLTAIFFNYFYKLNSKENVIRKLHSKQIFTLYEVKTSMLEGNVKRQKRFENKFQEISRKIDKISSWKNENYQLNFGLITSSVFLLIILFALILIVLSIPQEVINNSIDGILSLISHKVIFIIAISIGVGLCIALLVIARFKMKSTNYLTFVSVVTFIIFTEFINIPIIAYADYKALKISFAASAISSLVTSFVKIWFNTVVISFAIRVVMPMITKKTFNGYE